MVNNFSKKVLVALLFIFMSLFTYAESIRIMPLGDSITYGYPTSGGYRGYLWNKLQVAKYDVDFVGSQYDGSGFDAHHEGYGYWKTYDIAESVYGFLQDNPADIILLHIGSNDASPTQGTNSSSIAGLRDILDEIDRYEQNYKHPITVVLASIINRRAYHDTIKRFNINLRSLANTRISNGDKIILIDMENGAGLNSSHFADQTHPNHSGYNRMSRVWFDSLDVVIPALKKDDYAWLTAINHIILN